MRKRNLAGAVTLAVALAACRAQGVSPGVQADLDRIAPYTPVCYVDGVKTDCDNPVEGGTSFQEHEVPCGPDLATHAEDDACVWIDMKDGHTWIIGPLSFMVPGDRLIKHV